MIPRFFISCAAVGGKLNIKPSPFVGYYIFEKNFRCRSY